jgi:hypothetical protein
MSVLEFVLSFGFGVIVILWLLGSKYKFVPIEKQVENELKENEIEEDFEEVSDEFYDEENDDAYRYYVILPNKSKPIMITVETKLGLYHIVEFKSNLYIVDRILQRVNGHTIHMLKDYKPTL